MKLSTLHQSDRRKQNVDALRIAVLMCVHILGLNYSGSCVFRDYLSYACFDETQDTRKTMRFEVIAAIFECNARVCVFTFQFC